MFDIKETHIKKYNMHLMNVGYGSHTIARKNSSLRQYFKFLRYTGMVKGYPMEEIKQPMVEKKSIEINKEKLDFLEEKIMESGSNRDLLILYLLNKDKIKLSQIVSIKTKDYNQDQGILYLKREAISIHQKTKELLDKMMVVKQDEDYILLNNRGKKMSESGAYYVLKGYLKDIGCDEWRPIDLCK